jgi:hypothetical protein
MSIPQSISRPEGLANQSASIREGLYKATRDAKVFALGPELGNNFA